GRLEGAGNRGAWRRGFADVEERPPGGYPRAKRRDLRLDLGRNREERRRLERQAKIRPKGAYADQHGHSENRRCRQEERGAQPSRPAGAWISGRRRHRGDLAQLYPVRGLRPAGIDVTRGRMVRSKGSGAGGGGGGGEEGSDGRLQRGRAMGPGILAGERPAPRDGLGAVGGGGQDRLLEFRGGRGHANQPPPGQTLAT